MKIIVCFKEITDPALNLDFGLAHPVIFNEGRPRRLDPADAAAFSLASGLPGAEITAVSIGGEEVENYLRNALAAGAAQAVRIFLKDFPIPSPGQKARLLASLTKTTGAALVVAGARSADTGHGLVGPLIAAALGWPCVTDVTRIESCSGDGLVLDKDIGRGERERLQCSLPAVVTVKGEGALPYAPLENFIRGQSAAITVLDTEDSGITPEVLRQADTGTTRLTFPRPPTVKAPPLDSALPAFDRILQLLQGGIAKRKGQRLEGDTAQVAEQLYALLLEAGVLKKRTK